MTGRYAQAAWELAALPKGPRVLDVATGAGALLVAALRDGADLPPEGITSTALVGMARKPG
jgi:ubiquinone/menaquinone biosynthesis C-methylase UbiE